MINKDQVEKHSNVVKKLMIEQKYYYIKNNEKFRNELKMNQVQLTYALKHLYETGFLKPWNQTIYHI